MIKRYITLAWLTLCSLASTLALAGGGCSEGPLVLQARYKEAPPRRHDASNARCTILDLGWDPVPDPSSMAESAFRWRTHDERLTTGAFKGLRFLGLPTVIISSCILVVCVYVFQKSYDLKETRCRL